MMVRMRERGWRGVLAAWAAVAVGFASGAAIGEETDQSSGVVRISQASADPPPHRAEEESPAAEKASDGANADAGVTVVYHPPRRGAPILNVGAGGVRGTLASPRPLALAPDHVGLTQSAQPTLFWYIDAPPGDDLAVVFTLIDENATSPLVEREIDRPRSAGIQRVRLDRLGVTLAPEVDYEWSIALVHNDAERSQVAVTVGYLRRVAPEARPAVGGRDGAAYAAAGLWYDALTALGQAIEARPDDAGLRGQRNSLLHQANLEAAVE